LAFFDTIISESGVPTDNPQVDSQNRFQLLLSFTDLIDDTARQTFEKLGTASDYEHYKQIACGEFGTADRKVGALAGWNQDMIPKVEARLLKFQAVAIHQGRKHGISAFRYFNTVCCRQFPEVDLDSGTSVCPSCKARLPELVSILKP
jgi:hypothetical protein